MNRFETERSQPGEEPEKATEVAWLRENRFAFLAMARDYHLDQGRGVLVIIALSEPLSEDTPIHYALQALIEEQPDTVSQRLASFVSDYELAARGAVRLESCIRGDVQHPYRGYGFTNLSGVIERASP